MNKTILAITSFLLQAFAISAQDLLSGRVYFDQEFSVTQPANASYHGYSSRVDNAFVTKLFARPSIHIGEISFADKNLNVKHGDFIGLNADGGLMLKAHFKRNRLNGLWESWYKNKLRCDSGKLLNKIPDGEWKTWYEDGQLRSVRTYNAFKFHALHHEVKRNARSSFFAITGLAKRDSRSLGSHTSAANSYKSFAGNSFRNTGAKYSFKEIADINTSIEIEAYLPPFSECLHHGLYMNFFPNGAVKDSGSYRDGLRDGVWEEWIEYDNTLAIGFYHHGQKKGTWKYYDQRGKLLYIQHFNRQGKVVGSKTFVQ